MTDKGKKDLVDKFRNTLKETSEINKKVHSPYLFDQEIKDSHVGILSDEEYPQELKNLLDVFSNPAGNTKDPRGEKGRAKRKSLIGFAVKFKDVIAFKKITRLDIATGKRFKNAILIGSDTNKIQSFTEDFIILSMSEPDFISFSDDGHDPTIINNSNNFALFCIPHKYMIEELTSKNSGLSNILDQPEGLQEYLKKTSSSVHIVYYAIHRKKSPVTQQYIKSLNQEQFLNNKLQLDNRNRLICKQLSGKDIYNIIFARYGLHVNIDGQVEKVILDNYEKI